MLALSSIHQASNNYISNISYMTSFVVNVAIELISGCCRYQIPLAEIESWLPQCEPDDDEHAFELYPECYLFCRNFASNAVEAIVKVWSSLGIVTGSSHSTG